MYYFLLIKCVQVYKNSDEIRKFKLRICKFFSVNFLLQSNQFQVVFEAHGSSSVLKLDHVCSLRHSGNPRYLPSYTFPARLNLRYRAPDPKN